MPYNTADTSKYCTTCGKEQTVGHGDKCWYHNVQCMPECIATWVKYSYLADLTGAADVNPGETNPKCMSPDKKPFVWACTTCYRGRPEDGPLKPQDCYCGALALQNMPVMTALENYVEWLTEHSPSMAAAIEKMQEVREQNKITEESDDDDEDAEED